MNRRYPSLLGAFALLAAWTVAWSQIETPPLRPMIQVQPEYPETAVADGVQGFVELDVTVGEQGNVENATIVASVPEGVFDSVAHAAVMRWRYPAEAGRAAQRVTERIEFRVPVVPTIPERGRDAAAAAVGSLGGGSRNTCIREESKFNYGDRVEIVLINACDIPLAFASCASGTGQYSGRWTCSSTERAGLLLVAPDDARVGEVTLVEDASFTFTDRVLVSRSPNSEYWWLACTLDDAGCREAAAAWIRSLDGQLASADPQGRSPAPLARSY